MRSSGSLWAWRKLLSFTHHKAVGFNFQWTVPVINQHARRHKCASTFQMVTHLAYVLMELSLMANAAPSRSHVPLIIAWIMAPVLKSLEYQSAGEGHIKQIYAWNGVWVCIFYVFSKSSTFVWISWLIAIHYPVLLLGTYSIWLCTIHHHPISCCLSEKNISFQMWDTGFQTCVGKVCKDDGLPADSLWCMLQYSHLSATSERVLINNIIALNFLMVAAAHLIFKESTVR